MDASAAIAQRGQRLLDTMKANAFLFQPDLPVAGATVS